jgi:hypothetical protein
MDIFTPNPPVEERITIRVSGSRCGSKVSYGHMDKRKRWGESTLAQNFPESIR